MGSLRPGVALWSDTVAWPGRDGVRFRRTGIAVAVPERGVLAFVDPPAGGPGTPTHVVLTSADHVREAARWECPVLAHPLAKVDADERIEDGDRLWDAVEAIHLPHVYSPGETAFLAHDVLFVGDALCGGREDIGVPDGEVGLFSRRHVEDEAQARRSYERLLDLDFEVLAFGHGTPVTRDPKAALRRFLATC